MSGVEVQAGTPFAEALQTAIQPKLAEKGWSSGAEDDSALSEYIILMLCNGKSQDQIASELANDLLGLGPDDPSAMEFAGWLFEQVQALNAQMNGGSAPGAQPQTQMHMSNTEAPVPVDAAGSGQDATMSDGTEGVSGAPTGPKSMRNGPQGNQRGRDRRMLGQMRNAMDRSGGEQSLHRIKGAAGQGRINQHDRAPPRGPKNMANRMQNMMAGPAGQGMNPQMAQNMMNNVNPQQQMALFKMLEEQSRMMAQILGPAGQQQFGNAPAINPAFFNKQQQQGKSLFERVDRRKQGGAQFKKNQQKPSGDEMDTDNPSSERVDDGEQKESSQTSCKYQLSCTNPTCPFGHQSPAAPPGVSIDVADKCSFGPACQNKKCVGNHPSPAQRRQHLSNTVDCKFYPNCTNPSCPFRHPTTPPCRNGADCPQKVSGCKFSHSTIACRYNPCLNPHCPFKHEPGQRRGKFEDKVWTAGGEGFDREAAERAEQSHVSERKFVGEGEEELILPGTSSMEMEGVGAGAGAGAGAGDAGANGGGNGQTQGQGMAEAEAVQQGQAADVVT